MKNFIIEYIVEKISDSILGVLWRKFKDSDKKKNIIIALVGIAFVVVVPFGGIYARKKYREAKIKADAYENIDNMSKNRNIDKGVPDTADSESYKIAGISKDDIPESIGNNISDVEDNDVPVVIPEKKRHITDNIDESYLKFFTDDQDMLLPTSITEFERALQSKVDDIIKNIDTIEGMNIEDASELQKTKLNDAAKMESDYGENIDYMTILGIATTRKEISEELNNDLVMMLAGNNYRKLADMDNNKEKKYKIEHSYYAYSFFDKALKIKGEKASISPVALIQIGDIFYELAETADSASKLQLYFKALAYYKACEEQYIEEVSVEKSEMQFMIGQSYHKLLKIYNNNRDLINDGSMLKYLYEMAERYYIRAKDNDNVTIQNGLKYDNTLAYLRSGFKKEE